MADVSPIRAYIGDDWLVQVALVDTAGAPIDINGATAGVNFYTSDLLPAVDLAAAGGGLTVVQVAPALVLLTVPRAVTAGLKHQSARQTFFPCRAQVYLDDTRGRQHTAAILPFQPLDPRSTDLPSAVATMTAVTAVLSPQGPAGPSSVLRSYTVAIAARGQTVIPLQVPPSILSNVALEVNGSVFRPPLIGVSSVAVTWLNPDFALEPSDAVSLSYA